MIGMSSKDHEALTRSLALHLGHTSPYPEQLDPTLLSPVPRQLARDSLGLNSAELPFRGYDAWTGYELSWLDARGKPQVAIAEFTVPCTSPAIIESKSFKLFLNSLNQCRFSHWDEVQQLLVRHLSATAGATVDVVLIPLKEVAGTVISQLPGETIDDLPISVDDYQYRPELLTSDPSRIVSETLYSDLLKSNCLITNQPDWGSVMIRYTGPALARDQLLRYLISFRSHNEFHEQCVERIFVDLIHFCQPTALTVYARYTRRGGLDINPFRSNVEEMAPSGRLARQ